MRRSVLLTLAAAACVATTGCGAAAQARPDDRVRVVAGFYPLVYLAERVGGDAARVRNLTTPGAEPHDLELTARQVGSIEKADLVLYERGFQPAVDKAVAQEAGARALDVSEVVTREQQDGAADPHIWLDPVRMSALADAVTARLVERRPAQGDVLRARAAVLRNDLATLDGDYRAGLARCRRTDLVTSHEAFGYLARRYGLTQVGVSGLSPDGEPSPRHLAEVATLARSRGVTTIFFEDLVSPKTAQSLAREVGARAEVLTPLEGRPEGGDYLTGMRANLAALRSALDCS